VSSKLVNNNAPNYNATWHGRGYMTISETVSLQKHKATVAKRHFWSHQPLAKRRTRTRAKKLTKWKTFIEIYKNMTTWKKQSKQWKHQSRRRAVFCIADASWRRRRRQPDRSHLSASELHQSGSATHPAPPAAPTHNYTRFCDVKTKTELKTTGW